MPFKLELSRETQTAEKKSAQDRYHHLHQDQVQTRVRAKSEDVCAALPACQSAALVFLGLKPA